MSRTFEYLLNAMENAAQSDRPAEQGYAAKRRAVFQHVEDLQADYLRRHNDAVDYFQALATVKHRCGYIINYCRDLPAARLEAEELVRVVPRDPEQD